MNTEFSSHGQRFLQFRDAGYRPLIFRIAPASRRFRTTTSGVLMHIRIDAGSLTSLRRLIIGSFGDRLAFMRIQSINHMENVKVVLCLTAPIAARVMDAVMHELPDAEFGRITSP